MARAEEPARRSVLNWLLGLWGGGVLASIFYPVVRYLAPPEIPEATALSVSTGSAQALTPNSSRVVPFGARPAIVIRTPGGELRAFAATCTHLDCTVRYRPDLQRIWCACHNGEYDLNGRNVAGPPHGRWTLATTRSTATGPRWNVPYTDDRRSRGTDSPAGLGG
jgi:Rieske Fe-S protein